MPANPVGRPPGKNREATVKAILLAARKCFANKGFSGATIKEIAEMVGKTNRAIYQYYPSKTELYLATLADAEQAILPLYLQAIENKTSFKDKLKGVLYASAQAYQQEPDITGFLGTVPLELNRNPELAEFNIGQENAIMGAMIDMLDEAKQSGEVKSKLPSKDLVVTFIGSAMGIGIFQHGLNASSMQTSVEGFIELMDAAFFSA